MSKRSQPAKEQAVRLARMLTASTSITPEGFTALCRSILRDSRGKDFHEIYGESSALRRSKEAGAFDA
jgi:hypothetical protein